jgi:GntR family transcriptional regulator
MDPDLDLVLERGSKPLHLTITEQLAATIASGKLTPGMRLPPERQLAEALGVSRMTVRQALGDLERDGLVRRVVGRAGGTFVREPDEAIAATGTGAAGHRGLSAGLRKQGGATSVETISAEIEPAGKRVAAALDLKQSEKVVVITRLRLAGGKPLAVERTSLSARRFSDIEDMDLGGSLYDLMGDGFGLRPVRASERLELVQARPADARALGVRRDAPLILVERIGYAADGTPVEFSRDRFRADRTHLELESTAVSE